MSRRYKEECYPCMGGCNATNLVTCEKCGCSVCIRLSFRCDKCSKTVCILHRYLCFCGVDIKDSKDSCDSDTRPSRFYNICYCKDCASICPTCLGTNICPQTEKNICHERCIC